MRFVTTHLLSATKLAEVAETAMDEQLPRDRRALLDRLHVLATAAQPSAPGLPPPSPEADLDQGGAAVPERIAAASLK